MKITYQTGVAGEEAAAEWLAENRGMRLMESRYRNKAGEIDLIMAEEETIVFIEVKTRLHAVSGSGLAAVDTRKQGRIARAAMIYLGEKGWMNRLIRFDIVEVSNTRIIHVANAFQPGGMFYR